MVTRKSLGPRYLTTQFLRNMLVFPASCASFASLENRALAVRELIDVLAMLGSIAQIAHHMTSLSCPATNLIAGHLQHSHLTPTLSPCNLATRTLPDLNARGIEDNEKAR